MLVGAISRRAADLRRGYPAVALPLVVLYSCLVKLMTFLTFYIIGAIATAAGLTWANRGTPEGKRYPPEDGPIVVLVVTVSALFWFIAVPAWLAIY